MKKPNQSLGPTAGRCDDYLTTRFTKSDLRKDKRVVDLISDPLPFGRLWYGAPSAISNAIDYALSRSGMIKTFDARAAQHKINSRR